MGSNWSSLAKEENKKLFEKLTKSSRRPNVLIVGTPGAGKHSLVRTMKIAVTENYEGCEVDGIPLKSTTEKILKRHDIFRDCNKTEMIHGLPFQSIVDKMPTVYTLSGMRNQDDAGMRAIFRCILLGRVPAEFQGIPFDPILNMTAEEIEEGYGPQIDEGDYRIDRVVFVHSKKDDCPRDLIERVISICNELDVTVFSVMSYYDKHSGWCTHEELAKALGTHGSARTCEVELYHPWKLRLGRYEVDYRTNYYMLRLWEGLLDEDYPIHSTGTKISPSLSSPACDDLEQSHSSVHHGPSNIHVYHGPSNIHIHHGPSNIHIHHGPSNIHVHHGPSHIHVHHEPSHIHVHHGESHSPVQHDVSECHSQVDDDDDLPEPDSDSNEVIDSSPGPLPLDCHSERDNATPVRLVPSGLSVAAEERTAVLRWTKPEGTVDHYRITYHRRDEHEEQSSIDTTNTHYVISELQPGTVYRVNIFAITDNRYSAPATTDVVTGTDHILKYDAFVWGGEGNSEIVSKFVKEMVENLEKEGFRLFISSRDMAHGRVVIEQIHEQIEKSANVVVLLHQDVTKDPFFESSIKCSTVAAKPIIPVLIEEVDELPVSVRSLHYADFTRQENRDLQWRRLLTALQRSSRRGSKSALTPDPVKHDQAVQSHSDASTKSSDETAYMEGDAGISIVRDTDTKSPSQEVSDLLRRKRKIEYQRVIYSKQCRKILREDSNWSQGLGEIIQRHSGALFSRHSNLNAVSACPIIYIEKENRYDVTTCIVLYCSDKGVIPDGENQFPRELDGVRTDVREARFATFPGYGDPNRRVYRATSFHDPLKIGASVAIKGSKAYGSLGGFAEDKNDPSKKGFLTCCHVMLKDSGVEESEQNVECADEAPDNAVHLSEEEYSRLSKSLTISSTTINNMLPGVGTEVVQPSDGHYMENRQMQIDEQNTDRDRTCGFISDKHYFGNTTINGIQQGLDVIFVRVDKRKIDGAYLTGLTDLALENIELKRPVNQFYEPNFNSAEPSDITPGMKKSPIVYKCGCRTGLRKGEFYFDGAAVRRREGKMGDIEFSNLIEIIDYDTQSFGDPGDSGSFVFYLDKDGGVKIVGILMGQLVNLRTYVVVPINAALQQLNLRLSSFPPEGAAVQ